MHVFQRFPASHHQCSLIPFGAIILSQLLNGRDSIIPSNRTQSSWLANLRESPPGPQLSGPCQNKCLKMWHYECKALNGCSQGQIVYRSDIKGGHSAEYCCREKQTVVKIPPLFRCLVFVSPLFSWPSLLSSLSDNIYHTSHWKPHIVIIPLLLEECSYLWLSFFLCLLFQYHQNQRNQGPLWWRLGAALLSLLFDRGFNAGGDGVGRRWEGRKPSPYISSSLRGPGLQMALLNPTRVCFCRGAEKEDKKSPQDGDNPLLYKIVCFFNFQEDSMMLQDSSTRTMFIFW